MKTPTALIISCISLILTPCSQGQSRKSVGWKEYRSLKPELGFNQVHKPLVITNLDMIGEVGQYGVDGWQGKILRGLRFRDAAHAVEDRYNLPRNLVLAMAIHETSGADLLPNGQGDGGFGICHMQGSTASRFGLKTIDRCNTLVCNGRNNGKRGSCLRGGKYVDHSAILMDIIQRARYDRSKIIGFDERLHPILCLDAVGRMVAEGMDQPPGSSYTRSVGPLRRAMYRYSGRKEYFGHIARIMQKLEDENFLNELENAFNARNQKLLIGGVRANFDDYIGLMNRDLENYGLREYKMLTRYKPKNSEVVQATYRRFVFK